MNIWRRQPGVTTISELDGMRSSLQNLRRQVSVFRGDCHIRRTRSHLSSCACIVRQRDHSAKRREARRKRRSGLLDSRAEYEIDVFDRRTCSGCLCLRRCGSAAWEFSCRRGAQDRCSRGAGPHCLGFVRTLHGRRRSQGPSLILISSVTINLVAAALSADEPGLYLRAWATKKDMGARMRLCRAPLGDEKLSRQESPTASAISTRYLSECSRPKA